MEAGTNDPLKNFQRYALVVAAAVYAITSWFSTGYHSADEHFQIVAFAQAKLGELPIHHLPWEYATGIRSSLQPWIAVAVFKTADVLGIHDPFSRTFFLRFLTAALALVAIAGFIRVILPTVAENARKPFILLSYFLWFLPFLHVRFSSEGWSGIFLLLSISAILSSEKSRSWALRAGLFAGSAILCRPPVGLIVISLIAWLVFVRKENIRAMFIVCLGIFVVLVLGALMDTAFYGQWTSSTWKYLHMGFAGDPDHRFDELPWYYYPPWIIKYGIPPIGALILLAFTALCIKRPRHWAVWCVVPFVLIHSLIPHKELRFLYPLADLVPLILVLGLAELVPVLRAKWILSLLRIGAVALVVLNVIGLLVLMTSPAGEGRVTLAKALSARSMERPMHLGYIVPLEKAWRIELPAFYKQEGVDEVLIDANEERPWSGPLDLLIAHREDGYHFADRNGLTIDRITGAAPEFTEPLMRWYTWNEGEAPWYLYKVSSAER